MHSSMILASEKGQDEHHLGNEDVVQGKSSTNRDR